MSEELPILQFRDRPAIIDLAWGHPHPAALPVEEWAEASTAALRRHGAAALGYGYAAGPGPLIEWLCARIGVVDRESPRPDQVFVTGGASAALELVASSLAAPGATAIVDSPTYHLPPTTLHCAYSPTTASTWLPLRRTTAGSTPTRRST